MLNFLFIVKLHEGVALLHNYLQIVGVSVVRNGILQHISHPFCYIVVCYVPACSYVAATECARIAIGLPIACYRSIGRSCQCKRAAFKQYYICGVVLWYKMLFALLYECECPAAVYENLLYVVLFVA